MFEIQVWAQMFFDDGSVSEGKRVDAEIFDDPEKIQAIAHKLLLSVRRTEGFLLIWGAGSIEYYSIST